MTTSDVISLLGIGLAVWALISPDQKRFILLFFSIFEIWLYIILLFFLHYLIAFDWLLENWLPGLDRFTHPKGIPAKYYAYILSLGMIVYPIIKVNLGFFAKSKIEQLIRSYKSLMLKKQYTLIERQIEKYHLADIEKYLTRYSAFPKKEAVDIILERTTSYDIAYKKLVSKKRLKAAARVYNQIIQDPEFIIQIAPKNPELFATVISNIQNETTSNEEFVKEYLRVLFNTRSRSFWKEIKSLQESNESIVMQNKRKNLPVMYSILNNTVMAHKHSIWHPIGEATIHLIRLDEDQKELLLKEYRDSGLDEEFRNTPLWISIGFFNSMVRESIFRNAKWHMHLFYYQYFVEEILKLKIEKELDKTYAYKALELILNNLVEWLELNNELLVEHRYIDTYRCLLRILFSIIKKNERGLELLIINSFENVMNLHFETLVNGDIGDDKRASADYLLAWNQRFFLADQDLIQGIREERLVNQFNEKLINVWDNRFDKASYEMQGLGWSIERFENDIIDPLNDQ